MESRNNRNGDPIQWNKSVFLVIAILTALWIGMSFASENASGETGSFLYISEEGLTVTEKITYTPVTNNTQSLSEGWNVVQGTVDCGFLNCGKDSKLLLTDGSKLTAMIKVVRDNQSTQKLSVYGQSTYTETIGQLICDTNDQTAAGIGGWGADAGEIVINGGYIRAGEECTGPCIGSDGQYSSGDITINGGYVEAKNNVSTYACIGSGKKGKGGSVTINGGIIKTSGPGVGIGSGEENDKPVKVVINGGQIEANNTAENPKDVGVGIGAGTNSVPHVEINGGKIKAGSNGDTNPGIGVGGVSKCDENSPGIIKILGGEFMADRGIGYAKGDNYDDRGNYNISLGHSDPRDKIYFKYIIGNVGLVQDKNFLYLDKDHTGDRFLPKDVSTYTTPKTLVPEIYKLDYDLSGGYGITPGQGANPNYYIKLIDGKNLSEPNGAFLYRWNIGGTLYGAGADLKLKKTVMAVAVWTKAVTPRGIKAKKRAYDGTCEAELDLKNAVLTGVEQVDENKVGITAQAGAGKFDSKNAGKNKSVTIDITKLELTGEMAEKYHLKGEEGQLNSSADIDPRPVTVSGITANDREYDGTCDVTMNYANADFSNIVRGDVLGIKSKDDKRGTIQSPDVGNNKDVTLPDDLELTNNDDGNYVLSNNATAVSCHVNILPKKIKVEVSNDLLTYNGSDQLPQVRAKGLVGADTCQVHLRQDGAKKNPNCSGYSNEGTPLDAAGQPIRADEWYAAEVYSLSNGNYTCEMPLPTVRFCIRPKPVTVRAENKTCRDLMERAPLSWQMDDKEDNWYEAEDPAIEYKITDNNGIIVDMDQMEYGKKYIIEPSWSMGKENTNYSVDFVSGEFDTSHKLSETKRQEPTCTQSGTEAYRTCEICKRMFSYADAANVITSPVEIPATGHKYGEWTKFDANQHQGVCEHDKSHVVKENHKWDAGKETKKATEKATGVKTYNCTVCKATKNETIPKLTPTPKPPTPKVSKQPSVKIKAGKKSMTLGWIRIKDADGYDIFFARCNHSHKKIVCRKVKNIKGNNIFTWKKSGLKKGIAYKSYVKAYVIKNGKKKYVYTSPVMHAYTGNGTKKYTNAKSVKLTNVKKGKLTLKKGKAFKIKAKVNKVNKKKKLMPKGHAPTLRYMTSNKKIATVSKSGKITAKGKGTCYIYTFAHNGVSKRIKITVK